MTALIYLFCLDWDRGPGVVVTAAQNSVFLSACGSSSDIEIKGRPRSVRTKMIHGYVGKASDRFQPLTLPSLQAEQNSRWSKWRHSAWL